MGVKLHQFHMSADSCRYVFKSGKIAVFEGGIYRTTSESEANELKEQIEQGIGAIWQQKGSEIVDSDDIDPVAVFKRKVIEEYLANQARSLDNGESISDRSGAVAGMATSKTIAPITAGAVQGTGTARAVVPGSIRVGSGNK